MKKNRVRIEICLLLVVLLLTSLAFGQTVYAASYEPYNVNQSETETAIPILTTVPIMYIFLQVEILMNYK